MGGENIFFRMRPYFLIFQLVRLLKWAYREKAAATAPFSSYLYFGFIFLWAIGKKVVHSDHFPITAEALFNPSMAADIIPPA